MYERVLKEEMCSGRKRGGEANVKDYGKAETQVEESKRTQSLLLSFYFLPCVI